MGCCSGRDDFDLNVTANYDSLPSKQTKPQVTIDHLPEIAPKIPIKDIDLVNAYILDIVSLWFVEYIIPETICDLCYLFYHIPIHENIQ